ncbi:hypothetical protein ABL78_5913 [Leptomonas seymouri]|uniref:Uncharacterized protein n=1 Tax=Leptomonas seymouri TaxID=5684 RepID=A0A0N0P493_LEPSE|nr:hypothetical protein ABL78_5913 [Leptomonas seymouri]|eukprot:KPI85029.1 hypothetical protein ABL78_5913 [Leptomonas seymouri]
MSATLIQLIRRAAIASTPYNCQDAILVIKALSALRINLPEVGAICEKMAFSLASSPSEVETPVIIDVVNHLSSLQSAHFPVVRKVLVKRFCELPLQPSRGSSTPHVDPRTAQKAALVLTKLGRLQTSEAAVEHVLRLLHKLLSQRTHDVGLHMAYVTLYTYSARYAAQPRWWVVSPPHKPSVITLAGSIRFLLERVDVYTRASGTIAWQLLHLLFVLPPSSFVSRIGVGIPYNLIEEFESHCRTGTLARAVSGGAYAQFLHSFSGELCKLSPDRVCLLLSGVFAPKNSEYVQTAATEAVTASPSPSVSPVRRMNVYDATKLANTVAHTFSMLKSTLHHASPFEGARDEAMAARCNGGSDEEMLESTQRFSADSIEGADAWTGAACLSLSILDSIVLWQKQERLLLSQTMPASASTAFLDERTSPDCFLVASLLHAYANAVRFQQTPSLGIEAVTTLLRFVPALSDPAPTLLSWMLMSLVGIARDEAIRNAATCCSAARFLLHQYMCYSSTKRNLRSDVETLYGCLRLMEMFSVNTGSGPRPYARKQEAMPEGNAREGYTDPFAAFDPNPSVHQEVGGSSRTTPSAPLFSLDEFAALMQVTASRLHSAEAKPVTTVRSEDVDMLLAALIYLYSFPREMYLISNSGKTANEHSFSEALDALQNAVLCCAGSTLYDRVEHRPGGFSLRTVRLYLLSCLVANSGAACGNFAERLRLVQLSYSQHLHHLPTTAKVDSAVMLQSLALLQRRCCTADSVNALLRVLCRGYQKYLQQCAEPAPQQKTVEDIVRVFRRALDAGVQVCYGETSEESCTHSNGARLLFSSDSGAALTFPLALCRPEKLRAQAACDLLQLLIDASPTGAVPNRSQMHVLRKLASHLLIQLRQAPDPKSMIGLLRLIKSKTASQWLFSDKEELMDLLRCTEANASYLLERLQGDTRMIEHRDGHLRQASRFIAAVANSQLLFRLTVDTLSKSDRLNRDLLRLVQYVECNPQKRDAIVLLKIKLICGGIP